MKVRTGDLVWYNEDYWIVFQNRKREGVVVLIRQGSSERVETELSALDATAVLIGNPTETWHVLNIKLKWANGPVKRVDVFQSAKWVSLDRTQWYASDAYQAVPHIFLHPDLAYPVGTLFLVHHERGTQRVNMFTPLGTLKSKTEVKKKVVSRDIHDILLDSISDDDP